MTFLFIIFCFVSATVTITELFLSFETGKLMHALLFFIGILMIVGTVYFGSSILSKSPTKQDVLDGKAIYRETQVITGNDTIKTYEIVWK